MLLALLAVIGAGSVLVVGLLRRPRPAGGALPAPTMPPDTAGLAIADFYPIHPAPRYGHGKPFPPKLLAVLEAGVPGYRTTLESFRVFIPDLLEIARDPLPQQPEEPAWCNGYLPGLDALALSGMVSVLRPSLFLEVGSGNSTKFAARAKRRHSPQTRIVSIDPTPRVEVDGLCDSIIRQPLETADLAIFRNLTPKDILFFDGSHRVFQNSDVTVFFIEVLPYLPRGVTIHIHDIYWPHDYPPEWGNRYYSEQYMAALLLMFGEHHFDVLLPNCYVATCTRLGALFDALWTAPHLAGIESHGSSLWLRKR